MTFIFIKMMSDDLLVQMAYRINQRIVAKSNRPTVTPANQI